MDIKEILKLADELILAKTGKHLDYLQEAILRGTVQGQTYTQIAEETYMSEGHVKDVGSELWKIFSERLGIDITKSNFRSILNSENIYNFSQQIFDSDNITINNVNICPEPPRTNNRKNTPKNPKQLYLDLGDAPEIFSFYGRESEITTLQQWITEHRCRLIALSGISGIGKTTLAIRLIDSIKSQFDYIIYRSFRFSPSLEETLTKLLQIFSEKNNPQSQESKLSTIIDYFRLHRCLILLDDLQMLFNSQQFAGQYKSGCEDYQQFFQLVGQLSHNSCVMLIGSEKPRDIAKQEKENHLVRSFILQGLGEAAAEILRAQNLCHEASWETLINTYQGHPLWLQLTATMIQELCGGRVAEFLQYDTLILDESLEAHLDKQFHRLTQPEENIMMQLANESHPVRLPELCQTSQLSAAAVLQAMQSLMRRFFLETKAGEDATFFVLNPVLKQYVKSRC